LLLQPTPLWYFIKTTGKSENIQNTICTKMISLSFILKFKTSNLFNRHKAQASKAHTHGFYQLIWFTASGTHYVDYDYPKQLDIYWY
jgi:hypothetical protein